MGILSTLGLPTHTVASLIKSLESGVEPTATSPRTLHEFSKHYEQRVRLLQTRSTYNHGKEESWEETLEPQNLDMNCYGFVNYLIQMANPIAYRDLKLQMHKMGKTIPVSTDGMPCPFNLFAIFQLAQKRRSAIFESVPHANIRPGDILVYQPRNFSPPAQANFKKRRTGTHALIIDKFIASVGRIDLFWIIDCTRTSHSALYDSRSYASKKKRSGVGRAIIFLYRGKDGQYSEFKWNPLSPKSYKKDIQIGRINSRACTTKLAKLPETG